MENIFVGHNFIKINNNIDKNLYINLYNFNITSYQINYKRIKKTDNGYVIKFFKYSLIDKIMDPTYNFFNINNLDCTDAEPFIILEYLNNKIDHPYFFKYTGITKINNFFHHNEYVKTSFNIGIVMENCETLDQYLDRNVKLNLTEFIKNICNIVDLSIYIKNKYNIYHADVKLDNILVKDNTYYLIDWETIYHKYDMYYNIDRPSNGNTEMYPHYDASGEYFFIYSIGILMIRILGYHFNIKYTDFVKEFILENILEKIILDDIVLFEDLIYDIYEKKIENIEDLKNKLEYVKTMTIINDKRYYLDI